jgi:uncharacterized metal-binding protein
MRVQAVAVVYPCAGCPQWGDAARETIRVLERQGIAEMSGLNGIGLAKARARYPIIAIDACAAGCARVWLERHGAAPHYAYVLHERELGDAEAAAQRIQLELAP